MKYKHNRVCGVVVENVRCVREVVGSKPADCMVQEKCCDLRLWWSARVADQWGPPRIIFFSYF